MHTDEEGSEGLPHMRVHMSEVHGLEPLEDPRGLGGGGAQQRSYKEQ